MRVADDESAPQTRSVTAAAGMARPAHRGQRGLTEAEGEEDEEVHGRGVNGTRERSAGRSGSASRRSLLTLRASAGTASATLLLQSVFRLVPVPRPAPIPAACSVPVVTTCPSVFRSTWYSPHPAQVKSGSASTQSQWTFALFRSAAALTGIDSLPAVRRNQKVRLEEEERTVLLRGERLPAQRDESVRFPTTRSVSDDHLCQQTSLPHRLPHTRRPLLVREPVPRC